MAIMSNIRFSLVDGFGVEIHADASETDQKESDLVDGFRWVQTVDTNDPLNGASNQDVDQGTPGVVQFDPFYNRTPQSQFGPGHFEDHPRRGVPNDPTVPTTWTATLTLCSVLFAKKLLLAHDIRTYGFIQKVMDGATIVADTKLKTPQPVKNWADLIRHAAIVRSRYPSWTFAPAIFLKRDQRYLLPWPKGWWRVWDGGTWYYYLGDNGIAKSSKTLPSKTAPPAVAHNTGTWVTSANKLVITWKKVNGAPMACEETFWNAVKECERMDATSNLYSPLVATRFRPEPPT